MTTTDAPWYITIDNETKGPYTKQEILELLALRKITPQYYVWQEGFLEWKQITELRDEFKVPIPPSVRSKKTTLMWAMGIGFSLFLLFLIFGTIHLNIRNEELKKTNEIKAQDEAKQREEDLRIKNEIEKVKKTEDGIRQATSLVKDGKLQEALTLLQGLGEGTDIKLLIASVRKELDIRVFKEAMAFFKARKWQEAYDSFIKISDTNAEAKQYLDKLQTLLQEKFYQDGVTLLNQGKPEEAKEKLVSSFVDSNYKQTAKLLDRCNEQINRLEDARRLKQLDARARANRISYAMLKKNPDRYAGSFVEFTGKIFNITESGNETMMQINVTNQGYGLWTDQVIVQYKGTTNLVENNIIRFFGTIDGSHSYTSVAGWNITVPKMTAEYIFTQR